MTIHNVDDSTLVSGGAQYSGVTSAWDILQSGESSQYELIPGRGYYITAAEPGWLKITTDRPIFKWENGA